MKYKLSHSFIKTTKKLSGKVLDSVREMLEDVRKAERLEDISNCRKLTGHSFTYRIRVGGLRAFFVYYIVVKDGIIEFEYLVPRGEAYKKEMEAKLRKKDKKGE